MRTSMRASSSDDGITGSSLSEIAALDQLIDLLKGANGQEALAKLVAENLLAFDRQFWIRLATRSDGAQSNAEREQLTNLANVRGQSCCSCQCMRMQRCRTPALHALCSSEIQPASCTASHIQHAAVPMPRHPASFLHPGRLQVPQ